MVDRVQARRARNRRRNWLLMAVVLVMIVVLKVASFEPRPAHPFFAGKKPYVIAHQGGDGERPGNTLVAFRHAAALGVDVLEMDVHLSADGVPVTIHDATVDRTTNGSGAVAALTVAELQALDAGWHWPQQRSTERPWRGRGARIATLAEVLGAFPLARYNIELKVADPALAQAVCGLLKRHGAQRQTLVASFHDTAMAAFREACPDATTSALAGEVRWLVVASLLRQPWLYRGAADAVQVPVTWRSMTVIDPPFLRAAARAGLHVDAWTINAPEELQRLTAMGVGGIITDHPSRYLALLKRLPTTPAASAAKNPGSSS